MWVKKIIVFVAVGLLFCSCQTDKEKTSLASGMVITSNTLIKKTDYHLKSTDISKPVILIKGDGITVDFNGAKLIGSSEGEYPDAYEGLSIKVLGNNVVIKNVTVRGYKVGLLAKDSKNINISKSDFSYNYKQHLRSNQEREDISDWLSFHDNENNEWLRYGAGIYLDNCQSPIIEEIKITGGQNGILLNRCNGGLFFNNEINFNSGVGLGLYRSNKNKIMHNKLDWNVRGYSHNVYHRGQDSAGIVLFEQCSNNVIAYNSATHSGDGFFLWAGRETISSGEGGCNDNLIYGNDFSYAPTNGVEVTFSRNKIINNRIDGCDHGVWAGYSYNTQIIGNSFNGNKKAIAWEWGNNNIIKYNNFQDSEIGIWLWERNSSNMEFAKKRNVRSREYEISENTFQGNNKTFKISNTKNVGIFKNQILVEQKDSLSEINNSSVTFEANTIYHPQGYNLSGVQIKGKDNKWNETPDKFFSNQEVDNNKLSPEITKYAPETIGNGMNAMLAPGSLQGKKYILVNEWGPYDFRSPKLWLRNNKNGKLTFEILGPNGSWNVKDIQGLKDGYVTQGSVPGTFEADLVDGSLANVYIQLEYIGEEVTDEFGDKTEAGKPFIFTYSYYHNPLKWKVDWFTFNDTLDLEEGNFSKLINKKPVRSESTTSIAYRLWDTPVKTSHAEQFITVAKSSFDLEEGKYELGLTSDDGARLYVDGKLLIDHWEPHEADYKSIQVHLGGKHKIALEHYNLKDFSTLQFILKPVRIKID